MAKDFQEVRQEILAMHARIREENYYELLGVTPDVDAALVSARFRELAKKWHVDRFSSYDLGADKQKLQEMGPAVHQLLASAPKPTAFTNRIATGSARRPLPNRACTGVTGSATSVRKVRPVSPTRSTAYSPGKRYPKLAR